MSITTDSEIKMPTIISSSAIISAVLNGMGEATKTLNERLEKDNPPSFSLIVRKPSFGVDSKIEASICQEYDLVDMKEVFADTSFPAVAPEHSPLWSITLDMYELKRDGEHLHNLVKEVAGGVTFMFLGVDEARQYLDTVSSGVKKKVMANAFSTLEVKE